MAWCCRRMSEMELVGESIPSMLARAGEAKNTHFTMSLYCSKVRGWTVPEGSALRYLSLSCTRTRFFFVCPSLKCAAIRKAGGQLDTRSEIHVVAPACTRKAHSAEKRSWEPPAARTRQGYPVNPPSSPPQIHAGMYRKERRVHTGVAAVSFQRSF